MPSPYGCHPCLVSNSLSCMYLSQQPASKLYVCVRIYAYRVNGVSNTALCTYVYICVCMCVSPYGYQPCLLSIYLSVLYVSISLCSMYLPLSRSLYLRQNSHTRWRHARMQEEEQEEEEIYWAEMMSQTGRERVIRWSSIGVNKYDTCLRLQLHIPR